LYTIYFQEAAQIFTENCIKETQNDLIVVQVSSPSLLPLIFQEIGSQS
jgi:hypothetical protein